MSEAWPGEEGVGDNELWHAWRRFETTHPDATREILAGYAQLIMQRMKDTGAPGPIRGELAIMMAESALTVMADDILEAIHGLPETDEPAQAA